MGHLEYRRAGAADLSQIGEVFVRAFPESVMHYMGRSVSGRIMADAFAICLDSEPQAFFLAEEEGRVVAYVFAPSHLSRVFRTAVVRGHLLRMFVFWLARRYGVGIRPAVVAVRNWVHLWQDVKRDEVDTDARILSVAVDPDFQGRGIGTRLVELGLEYLEARKLKSVRLEVRPDNRPAKHVYEKLGFEPKGMMHDTQGDWLIMLKDFSHGVVA